MVRKWIALLLVAVFIYQAAGYFIFFTSQKYVIREEIKNRIRYSLPEDQMTKWIFKPGSDEFKKIHWYEENEFRYRGKMYDVVRQENSINGEIIYYCINDSQEEALFKNLDQLVENEIDQQKQNHQKIKIKTVIDLFYYKYLTLRCLDKIKIIYYHPFLIFFSNIPDTPAPPPWIV